MKCKRSRGYPFETFSFEVNDLGLPQIVGDLYDPLKDNEKRKLKIYIKNIRPGLALLNLLVATKVLQKILCRNVYKNNFEMEKGLDIKYNKTEINYYYIFRILNSLYIDLTRKKTYILRV